MEDPKDIRAKLVARYGQSQDPEVRAWLMTELMACDRAIEQEELNVGDARRCPHHPHIKTSSEDGMHDAPCHACEAAMDDDDFGGYPSPTPPRTYEGGW
jgi:hypothetical protein